MPAHPTTRTPLPAALATASLLLLSACGGNNTDDNQPSNTTTNTDTKPPLAQINPCNQLTTTDKEKLNTDSTGKFEDILGAKTCSWKIDPGQLTVGFHPDKGIEEINFSEGEQKLYSIQKSTGKIVRGNTGKICTISLPYTDSSTVNIDGNMRSIKSSCELAKKAAPMVWENLSEQ
ncbi:DUF3558 family protein [Actinopolyspora mortivallis]|uniref:DUF3558 domain-containing protein n=1 Tax=Actinopolyspora mortivallis TaxID=33906 RepID=A0A2T0GW41_ACTMO|nr:DUF3558 family protein [Actinopolyspora mortivallis]PRW63331.1 hypothetical protein CEP50_10970 [Actinopolyspora mortivallis]